MTESALPLPALDLVSFIACDMGVVRGYATIELPEVGLQIRKMPLFCAGDADWFVMMPTAPERSDAGELCRKTNGKVLLRASVSIEGARRWKAFQHRVVALIRAANSDVFGDGPPADPAPALPAFITEAAA